MLNRKLGIRLHVAAISVVIALMFAPAVALAQSDNPAGSKRVTLNLENADLKYAVKLLFTSAGLNYTLDQAVGGTVTLSLSDVPFRTALESLLRSTQSTSKLTYRVEDSVYNIFPKKDDDKPEVVIDNPTVEPPKSRLVKVNLNFADAEDIANAFGGKVLKSRFGGNIGATVNGGSGLGNFGNGFNGGSGLQNGGGPGSGLGNFGNGFNNGFGNGFNNGSNFGSGNNGRGNGSQGRGR